MSLVRPPPGVYAAASWAARTESAAWSRASAIHSPSELPAADAAEKDRVTHLKSTHSQILMIAIVSGVLMTILNLKGHVFPTLFFLALWLWPRRKTG